MNRRSLVDKGIAPVIFLVIFLVAAVAAVVGGFLLFYFMEVFGFAVGLIFFGGCFFLGYKGIGRFAVFTLAFACSVILTVKWMFSEVMWTVLTLGIVPLFIFTVYMVFYSLTGLLLHWVGFKIGGEDLD